MRLCIGIALCAVLAACGEPSAESQPTTAPPPTTALPDTTPRTTLETTTTTTSTTVPFVDWEAIVSTWEVSLRAVGPFQIGMTVDEASAAGGAPLFEAEHQDPSCAYYTHDPSTGLDQELRFMVRAGRIVRIDIDGDRLKTLSGLGNGNTKAELTSTYGNGVIVSPSHTGNSSDAYVTFIPFDEGDADFRLRFETTDDIVTTFRIGRLPEVEWVDRCV